eukprot:CAMPEP_0197824382 /NCGR_PEP_ID=MMETSP1437-20131217/1637_1 /TAXON_ID=49252 ORGANISM="Eucampia antarctica, Strain CCMP1452" /NCGR_SAMPLE_ID=MMETSP1437 /ASSEMBLY_ACC=CAM_ASM_001096 /LENGTH=218 /DNA_ID=CAMNT_0043423985 /DNA_START=173 /DNA_END=829 /DNA_ORIENTATION=+
MTDKGNVAGSFFNPVPPPGDDNNGKEDSKIQPEAEVDEVFDFDRGVAELMKKRNSKPIASTPSTLGGVPTANATGFGKKSPDHKPRVINTTSKETEKKSFVGIGKPLNDVSNPQYDDQGYTLYADEETGEQKRVFEALVDYPCEFPMKIVGLNEGAFVAEIIAVVAESCQVSTSDINHSERKNGKYVSVTVNAPVQSAEMLYALYENIDRDPRVKFKF